MNNIFAMFLKLKNHEIGFKKTKYGYRTYDGIYKLYFKNRIITKTTIETIFEENEYISVEIESTYEIVENKKINGVSVRFLSDTKYYI